MKKFLAIILALIVIFAFLYLIGVWINWTFILTNWDGWLILRVYLLLAFLISGAIKSRRPRRRL